MMKILLLFLLLTLPLASLQAEDCADCSPTQPILLPAAFDKGAACKKLVAAKTKDELQKALYDLSLVHNKLLVPAPKDRHEVGKKLNDCTPESNSKGLVISFAGTGAYDPRADHLMTYGLSCFGDGKKLDPGLHDKYYETVKATLKAKGRGTDIWSAIDKGIIPLFLSDEKLSVDANKYDFASFPSEESELIADVNNITWDKITKLNREMSASAAGIPKGIVNAIACTAKYLKKAREMNITPKVIVLTHSSGGRSAVKYHEAMKKIVNPLSGKMDFKSDLVFTIDPVIEAHEAIKEVADQYAGKAVDAVNPFSDGKKQKIPVKVWSRDNSDRLYKTSNAKKWYSVYQTQDTKGLGIKALPFGIAGSHIKNADKNLHVTGFTKNKKTGIISAHGDIGYRDETRELFLQQVHATLYK